jgi:hypothetical protein
MCRERYINQNAIMLSRAAKMDITIFFARFWGSLFMILAALSIGAMFLGRVIGMTKDRSFTMATGYITLLLGLVTVILHNVWTADWRIAITILGWSTLLKGIMKVGFPGVIHKQAQMFKSQQTISAIILFLLGAWFFWMSL